MQAIDANAPAAAAGQDQELSPLRQAVALAILFSAAKFALHLGANLWQSHTGWGYFRDELYYLICGRHLDWGYVDHGPIVALQARLGVMLFGKSLAGIRMLSALAGAAKIFLTGLLTWSLGGRRSAQALAMTGVLVAPQYLALDSFLSMNSFEPVFWMAVALCLILLARSGSERWWIALGLAAGLGMENKPSMLVFLVALLGGLLLTPQRRVLASRSAAVGIGLIILLALPNLLWQIHYHWPTLEFLHNGQIEHKNVRLPIGPFLAAQIRNLNPLNLLLWGAGLGWLLGAPGARRFRWIGSSYLFFLLLMFALHAKDYYLAPIYPVLFAAGGVAWQRLLRSRRTAWLVPTYTAVLLLCGVLLLPTAIPVLSPAAYLAYAERLHLGANATENERQGPLPQFYADRFGWQELADQVARIYAGLPPEERAKAGVLCSNYGEASAINALAKAPAPVAVSGHNSYWLWGPHGYTGEVLIVINGATPEEMLRSYASVTIAGEMDHPYAMPYEHRHIYLCRGRKRSLLEDWPEFKHYI